MFLTTSYLPHYLIDRGLISAEAVVRGDLKIVELLGRNRNFKILRRHGPSLFLKQVRTAQSAAIKTAQQEACLYRAVNSDARFAALRAVTPPLVDEDSRLYTLTLNLLSGVETLSTHHQRDGGFPQASIRLLGATLANVHAKMTWLKAGSLKDFPGQPPEVFSVHRRAKRLYPTFSHAGGGVLRRLETSPALTGVLDRLYAEWCSETLIHGDVKWTNLLIDRCNEQESLFLVDWELSDTGDPAWDVAGVLHSFLVSTLIEDHFVKAVHPMTLQGAVQRFLTSYADRFPSAAEHGFLRRCALFTGARLLQAAFELAESRRELNQRVDTLFRTGADLLTSPGLSARHLLGIEMP